MWTIYRSASGWLIFTKREWTSKGPVESKVYVAETDADRDKAEAFAATLS